MNNSSPQSIMDTRDMLEAIKGGQNKRVKELLDGGFEVNQSFRDDAGEYISLPLLAIIHLNAEALDLMVSNGAKNPLRKKVMKELSDKQNPFSRLIQATNAVSLSQEKLDRVKDNIKELYNVFLKNDLMDNSLAKAYAIQSVCSDVKPEGLKELIRNGFPLNVTFGRNKYSLAHQLVRHSFKKEDCEDLLRLMVDKGLDFSKADHTTENIYQVVQKRTLNLYQNPVWQEVVHEYLAANPEKDPSLKIKPAPLAVNFGVLKA